MAKLSKPEPFGTGIPAQPELSGWEDVKPIQGDTFGEVEKFIEPGDWFIGRYDGSETVDLGEDEEGTPQTAVAHRFTDLNDVRKTVWGSHDLNAKLAEVAEGALVRIEFMKTLELKAGHTLRLYKVQTR